MNSSLLTVVIVNFNQSNYIAKCLKSVVSSGFLDMQLIVIDDKSSDDSVNVITQLLNASNIECEFIPMQENSGICKCLNIGLSKAVGKYFTFIAADDWGDSWRFSSMIKILESDSEIGVVYSDAVIVDEGGGLINKSFIKHFRPDLKNTPTGNVFTDLLENNFIPAMAAVTRTDSLKTIGGFDESLVVEDYDIWLRLSRVVKFAFDPDSFCYYRIIQNSLIRRIGPRKYEDWIIVYLKNLNISKEGDRIIKEKLYKCCEFLFYTGSKHFSNYYTKVYSVIGFKPKLFCLNLFNLLGVDGTKFKSFFDYLLLRR